MTLEVLFQLNLSPKLPPEIQELAIQQGEDDKKYELIDQLRSLIFEKGKCTPHRTDDEYLTKFLRARFWKVEQSYQLLCNYHDFRKKNRKLYENVSCDEVFAQADDKLLSVTPYRDGNGRRILIIRHGTWEPSVLTLEDLFRLYMMIIEMASMEPISQVTGVVAIYDLGDVSFNHLRHLTPSVAQKVVAVVETSAPLRATAVHIVNQNWFFNAILNMFKPFLNASMRERLIIHGSDMSSLHKYIDPEFLPERYGGVNEDHPYSNWSANLKQDTRVRRQLQELGYNVDTVE